MGPDDELDVPVIPARARTGLYVAGALLGIGVGPSLFAFGFEPAAVAAGAFAGACNLLAFGYRPTRSGQ